MHPRYVLFASVPGSCVLVKAVRWDGRDAPQIYKESSMLSPKISRLSVVVFLSLINANVNACGPFIPNHLLTDRNSALLEMPNGSFVFEVQQLVKRDLVYQYGKKIRLKRQRRQIMMLNLLCKIGLWNFIIQELRISIRENTIAHTFSNY